MPVLTREQYSRKQTVDLETALALAVLRVINKTYQGPGGFGALRFEQLYEDWPSFEDADIVPSAVVMPDAPLLYGPSHPVPRLLEDTWENRGEPGLGLYQLSEATREFDVQFRGSTTAERNALKAGLEGIFVDDRLLIAPKMGARYGVLEAMPEYWGLTARLVLLSSVKLDDQESAAKNIAEGRVTVKAYAPHVRLGLVQPFKAIVRLVTDDPSVP